MVEDGIMDRFGVHEIDGMPNQPGLPVGRFAIESGALLAAADEFTVEIEGHGGHAAHPQYDFDDVAIPVGCSFRVRLAETALPLRRGGAVKW